MDIPIEEIYCYFQFLMVLMIVLCFSFLKYGFCWIFALFLSGGFFPILVQNKQAYTNELELEVAHLTEENTRLKEQQRQV